MASSEIEVVSSSSDSKPNENHDQQQPSIVDVFTASAHGDFHKLRSFVEQDGASVSVPDANGYYALQWASLNNFYEIVHYLIKHGGDVSATDHMQQTALHWAAVRGSTAAADLLLENGARVEAADINGYRAVHVAAQYGQTAFLNHIVVKYHADFDMPDNDGRRPLHWAAYTGFTDTIRLLLFRDASQERQDKDGCTPLHWAALRGHSEACAVLVHAGTKKELTVKDNAGFTPVQLAYDKGHRHVALFLSNQQRAHSNHWRGKLCSFMVTDTGYAPILFCIIVFLMILFINSVVAATNLKKITAFVGLWAWTALSLAVGSLIMFYKCSSKDPGYIKRPGDLGTQSDAEDPLLNIDLNSSSVWAGNWSQLCPTCKIIRPVRSKHCPTCKRCVEQFDHHCPWISNCVGKRNKRDFFIFICFATLTSSLSAVITVQRIWTSTATLSTGETWFHHVLVRHPGVIVFLVIDAFVFSAATTLTITQASMIARNLTTNEVANSSRYEYLRGPDVRFRNPYNNGCWKNCADFVLLGYTDDDVIAWPPLEQFTIYVCRLSDFYLLSRTNFSLTVRIYDYEECELVALTHNWSHILKCYILTDGQSFYSWRCYKVLEAIAGESESEQNKKKTVESVVIVKKSQLSNDAEVSFSESGGPFDEALPEISRFCERNVLIRVHWEKNKGVVEKTMRLRNSI